MKSVISVVVLFFCSLALAAQTWLPNDIGVGLVIFDGSDTELKISRRGNVWNPRELLDSGALNGRTDGTAKFALWISGTPDSNFKDKNGQPYWNWSYRITWPDKTYNDFGIYGFKSAGFDASMFQFGRFEKGEFAIDFWIHRRSTGEKIHVGRVTFTATDSPSGGSLATPITISDRGVGLVILDDEYASKLKISDRSKSQWSMEFLLSSGAMNGRTDGKPHFCAWLVGPPTSTYQDESGRPKYVYRYRIVNPDGTSWESSSSYFYDPGFACVGLNPYLKGKHSVEFTILTRDGSQKWPAGTVEFFIGD